MKKQQGFILLIGLTVILAVIIITGGSLKVVLDGECKYWAEETPGPICQFFGYEEESTNE